MTPSTTEQEGDHDAGTLRNMRISDVRLPMSCTRCICSLRHSGGLGILAVDAQLRGERKVGTELDEQRAEIVVDAVHIEVVDHRAGVHQPRVGRPGDRVTPTYRGDHPGLLL